MSEQHPNVLVFFTDQQRWDTCGCYGNPMRLTPNLDALAAGGVRFEHAITCQPVCAPARACLQTGLHATAAGVWRNGLALPTDRRTLADYFNEAGYDTGYIGKWHLADTGRAPVPAELRGRYRHWIASDLLEFTSHPNDGVIFGGDNQPIRLHGYRVDAMTNLAIDFLRQKRSSPFFLFLSYIEPHFQNDMKHFVAPDGYADRYRDCYVPPDLRGHKGDWEGELPDYYGMCASLDENLGRLLAELDREGLRENTILAFLSDHGCHFFTREAQTPRSEYKRTCHESAVRIPLVLGGAGLFAQRAVPEVVSLVDVPPTLLAAAGLPVPASMQGRNLLPLAAGEAEGWNNEVLIQISESQIGRALRNDRWKYCVVAEGKNGWQESCSDVYVEQFLYDLAADPWEQTNLIGESSHRSVAESLRPRLVNLMVQAGEAAPRILPPGKDQTP